MAFQKYEAPAKPSKAAPDVKIGRLGISINRGAMEKVGLADAAFVNLWYDPDTQQIGVTASSQDDGSAFKTTPRGKNQSSIFIAAGKFYSAFGITLTEKTANSTLEQVDGIAAFELPGKKTASPRPYTGAKRGRKPKNPEA